MILVQPMTFVSWNVREPQLTKEERFVFQTFDHEGFSDWVSLGITAASVIKLDESGVEVNLLYGPAGNQVTNHH